MDDYNTSTGEVKVGGSRVQGQPCLHNEFQGQSGPHEIISEIKQNTHSIQKKKKTKQEQANVRSERSCYLGSLISSVH